MMRKFFMMKSHGHNRSLHLPRKCSNKLDQLLAVPDEVARLAVVYYVGSPQIAVDID